jgi:hypothetical protein
VNIGYGINYDGCNMMEINIEASIGSLLLLSYLNYNNSEIHSQKLRLIKALNFPIYSLIKCVRGFGGFGEQYVN